MQPLKLLRLAAAGSVLLIAGQVAWSQASKGEKLEKVEKGDIVLGQSGAYTGPTQAVPLEFRLGARTYFNQLNEAGGVNGRKVKLISMDDGFDAKVALENAREMLATYPEMLAFFSFTGTAITSAMLPLIEEKKIVYFAPLTGDTQIYSRLNRHMFMIRAGYLDEVRAITKQLAIIGQRKMAVATLDDALGRSVLKDIVVAAKENGITIVASEKVDLQPSLPAIRASVQRVAKSGAQVLLLGGAGRSMIEFVKEGKAANLPPSYYSISILSIDQAYKTLGAQARGIVISQLVPRPDGRSTAISREFRDALFKADPKARLTHRTFEGYIAAKVMTEAIRRAGSKVTRETLLQTLETMTDYDAGGMKFSFSPKNHLGTNFIDLVLISTEGRVVN